MEKERWMEVEYTSEKKKYKWAERSIELTNLLATRQRGIQWGGQKIQGEQALLLEA